MEGVDGLSESIKQLQSFEADLGFTKPSLGVVKEKEGKAVVELETCKRQAPLHLLNMVKDLADALGGISLGLEESRHRHEVSLEVLGDFLEVLALDKLVGIHQILCELLVVSENAGQQSALFSNKNALFRTHFKY